MKEIKIGFIDFWASFDIYDNMFIDSLSKSNKVRIVSPEDADYVFYSLFSRNYLQLSRDKIFVFYTPENYIPDFNICDYAIGYDLLEFGDRYLRMPYYVNKKYRQIVELAEHKHELIDPEEFEKLKVNFCSFTVTNEKWVNSPRCYFFDLLSQYKKVDSGGRWKNNIGGPIENKFEFDQSHKFSIAFENSSRLGYTTEKLVEAFAAKTVPIYYGDPSIEVYFNTKAFVNVHDFQSLSEVVDAIKIIDNDKELYMSYINQPIYKQGQPTCSEYLNRLDSFLENIVSQPLELAKRRNDSARGMIAFDEALDYCNYLKVKPALKIFYKFAIWVLKHKSFLS